MKIVHIKEEDSAIMETFLDDIKKHSSTRKPAMFIGWDNEDEPVLHLMPMSWKQLAYLKVCIEQHVNWQWGNEE